MNNRWLTRFSSSKLYVRFELLFRPLLSSSTRKFHAIAVLTTTRIGRRSTGSTTDLLANGGFPSAIPGNIFAAICALSYASSHLSEPTTKLSTTWYSWRLLPWTTISRPTVLFAIPTASNASQLDTQPAKLTGSLSLHHNCCSLQRFVAISHANSKMSIDWFFFFFTFD